eukprot:715183-Prymnesium_polylepis.1
MCAQLTQSLVCAILLRADTRLPTEPAADKIKVTSGPYPTEITWEINCVYIDQDGNVVQLTSPSPPPPMSSEAGRRL